MGLLRIHGRGLRASFSPTPNNGLYPVEKLNPNRWENAKRIPVEEAKALTDAIVDHHDGWPNGDQIREIKDRIPGFQAAHWPTTRAGTAIEGSSSSTPIPK